MFKYTFLFCILVGSLITSVVNANGVDPTKPLTFQAGATVNTQKNVANNEKLVLEAIIHGINIHTVVINNQKLKTGERIGKYKLVAVNDDNVLLRSQEDTIRLYVFSGVKVK